jgi:hypothetical protein
MHTKSLLRRSFHTLLGALVIVVITSALCFLPLELGRLGCLVMSDATSIGKCASDTPVFLAVLGFWMILVVVFLAHAVRIFIGLSEALGRRCYDALRHFTRGYRGGNDRHV